ncbi:MAG: ABC transporter permease [Clostridia bacterium]|nr:ABC transporter permease [Clostridia bacterium]
MSSTYFISEGFKNVFKNKKASMASLLTMFCAMFIFGIVFVIGENANSVVEQVSSSQGIQVFMNTEATDEQMEVLESSIWALGTDKISTVSFVSKQEALESMKESFGEDSQWIFEGYEGENNIFPVSYIVTLTNLSYTKEVEDAILKMENVNKITSSNETIDTLIKIANGVKIAVSVIFVLLLVMAVTIIANTIKLTVHSRRKEISIMKYVGATNSFIRGPFMIEGIIIGVVSAALTLLGLATVYDLVIEKVAQSSVLQTMGLLLLDFSEMVQVIGIIFLGLGIGIGIVGSSISMKKYLEV